MQPQNVYFVVPPSYLQDYKCSTITSNELTQSNPINSKSAASSITLGTKYPLFDYLDSSHLSLLCQFLFSYYLYT